MKEQLRILWEGPLDEHRYVGAPTSGDRTTKYRILLVPSSTHLWIEECLRDRLGVDAWTEANEERVVMVLETALVALAGKQAVEPLVGLVKARTKSDAEAPVEARRPAGEPVTTPQTLAPIDDALPFRTGEYVGKRLSDLQGADLKKLALGFLRMAKEAQSETGKNDKLAWLHQLQLWANFRGANTGPDGRVWPNWPEPPGENV